MPRFLARRPYGAKSDPVEEFDFEEDTGAADHSRYIWANAAYAMATLKERFGDDIQLHGSTNVEVRGATFSFAFRDIHPHDLATILDQHKVAVRAGHHCAQPLMDKLNLTATTQIITFPGVGVKRTTNPAFALTATSSSGAPLRARRPSACSMWQAAAR